MSASVSVLQVRDIYSILKIGQRPIPRSFYEELDPVEMADPEVFLAMAPEKPREEIVIEEMDLHLLPRKKKMALSAPRSDDTPSRVENMDDLLGTRGAEGHSDSFRGVVIPELLRTIFGESRLSIPCLRGSNRSIYFRFMDSVFTALDLSYRSFTQQEREEVHRKWVERLDHELFYEHRYQEFQYGKSRKITKEALQQTLNDALTRHQDPKIFHCFVQYTADMLSTNLMIWDAVQEKSEFYSYKSRLLAETPLLVLYRHDMVYYPVLKGPDELGVFAWTPLLTEHFGWDVEMAIQATKVVAPAPKIDSIDYSKHTVDELIKMCRERGITITKVSPKTGLLIKKKKSELIESLL